MNLRTLRDRIVSSTLALGMIGILVELGAQSVSAQSMNATMPFSFCVNNQAYPIGEYRLTLISPWLLSIRNLNGGGELLFPGHPGVRASQVPASDPVRPADGVIFTTFQGLDSSKQFVKPA